MAGIRDHWPALAVLTTAREPLVTELERLGSDGSSEFSTITMLDGSPNNLILSTGSPGRLDIGLVDNTSNAFSIRIGSTGTRILSVSTVDSAEAVGISQNLDVGSSGVAGTIDVFPATASSGKLAISVSDQTGDTTVDVIIGAMAAARTIVLRDPGTAASFLTTTDGTAAATDATAVEITRACDVSARIVNVTATPLAVTQAAHDSKTLVLDKADGLAITLPDADAAAVGCRFRFIVKTTFTSASTIKSSRSADIMIGHALMGNNTDNTVVDFQATAADTFDTIDLLGTANSTGGMAGQVIEIECLAANRWFVEIRGDAAGTEATPFQNTVA